MDSTKRVLDNYKFNGVRKRVVSIFFVCNARTVNRKRGRDGKKGRKRRRDGNKERKGVERGRKGGREGGTKRKRERVGEYSDKQKRGKNEIEKISR